MAIPDYQNFMLPLLEFTADKQEHSVGEACESIASRFKLSPEDRQQLLPSGRQPIFENRIGWAKTYLKKAGLLEYPRRGYIRITARGIEAVEANPARIDNRYLEQFVEFQEFKDGSQNDAQEPLQSPTITEQQTPEESIETAYGLIRGALATEILSRVKSCSPAFFERLVIDLLVSMGYGGSRRDAGRAVGRSGDGGIDGIINEDPLGLDVIYVQAKRWEGTVGRPEIQKFVGALSGHRAHKGVFITTSAFSGEAIDYVSRIENKIILIDGRLLADLMIDHSVGVSPQVSYEIKRLDSDYFVEE